MRSIYFSTFLAVCVTSYCWAQPVHRYHSKPARSAGKPLTPRELAKLAMPSVVRLTVLDASGQPSVLGSGFVVGNNLIVTNVHVISGAHAVTANFLSGRSETVPGLVASDKKRDIAIIYANTKAIPPLHLAPDSSGEVGDPVVAVGSPEGFDGSVSSGIISAFRMIGSAKIIQTTAAISHGSSGGPLLDSYGRVIGVTSLFYDKGQALNFAYASQYIRRLIPAKKPTYVAWSTLEQSPKAPATPSTSLPSASTPAQIQRIVDIINDYNTLLDQEKQLAQPTLAMPKPSYNTRALRENGEAFALYNSQISAYISQRDSYLSKALSLYNQIKDDPIFVNHYLEGDRANPESGVPVTWIKAGYYNLRYIRERKATDAVDTVNLAKLDDQVEDYLTLIGVAGRGPFIGQEGGNEPLTDNQPDPYGFIRQMREQAANNRAVIMKIALPLYQQILSNPLFATHYHLGGRCFDTAHTPLAIMGTDAEQLTQIVHN